MKVSVLAITLSALLVSGCSANSFWNNTEKTTSFFSDNLVFSEPENLRDQRHKLSANIATLRAAQEKRQEISYDPYYPIPKPWSEKPEATHLFP